MQNVEIHFKCNTSSPRYSLARPFVRSFVRLHASAIGKANNILKAEPNSKNQQVQAA